MSMPSGSMSIDSDMHIRDALALPLPATTNALPREVHAALRRSDRKAGKVLGVTVTRDVAPSQTGLDLLFADHETFGRELEKVRNFSLVGVLKGLNLNIARNRSRARREGRSERVVLGALGDITSVASSDDEKESDGKIISFLPLDHGRSFNHDDELKTPTAGDFDFGSESDDDDEEEEEFVWDCANPFATPPNTPANTLSFELKKRYEAVCPLTKLATCSEAAESVFDNMSFLDLALELESIEDIVSPSDSDEADAIARRKYKRANLRSRMKALEILGAEAREACA